MLSSVKLRILDQIKQTAWFKIPPEMVEVDPYMEAAQFAEDIIVHIRVGLYAERLHPYTFSKPKNWWQHFKQDCFPEWLLEYFPVQDTKIVVSSKVMYPEYVPPYPNMPYVMVYEIGDAEYTDPKEDIQYCERCGYPQLPNQR